MCRGAGTVEDVPGGPAACRIADLRLLAGNCVATVQVPVRLQRSATDVVFGAVTVEAVVRDEAMDEGALPPADLLRDLQDLNAATLASVVGEALTDLVRSLTERTEERVQSAVFRRMGRSYTRVNVDRVYRSFAEAEEAIRGKSDAERRAMMLELFAGMPCVSLEPLAVTFSADVVRRAPTGPGQRPAEQVVVSTISVPPDVGGRLTAIDAVRRFQNFDSLPNPELWPAMQESWQKRTSAAAPSRGATDRKGRVVEATIEERQ